MLNLCCLLQMIKCHVLRRIICLRAENSMFLALLTCQVQPNFEFCSSHQEAYKLHFQTHSIIAEIEISRLVWKYFAIYLIDKPNFEYFAVTILRWLCVLKAQPTCIYMSIWFVEKKGIKLQFGKNCLLRR